MDINNYTNLKNIKNKKTILYGDGLNKLVFSLLNSEKNSYDLANDSIRIQISNKFKLNSNYIFEKYKNSLDKYKNFQFEKMIDLIFSDAKNWEEFANSNEYRKFCLIISNGIFKEITDTEKDAASNFKKSINNLSQNEYESSNLSIFENIFLNRPKVEEESNNYNVKNIIILGKLILKLASYNFLITTNYNLPKWIIENFDSAIKSIISKHTKININEIISTISIYEDFSYYMDQNKEPSNILGVELYSEFREMIDVFRKNRTKILNLKSSSEKNNLKTIRINNYRIENSGERMFIDRIESTNTKDDIFENNDVLDVIDDAWKNSAIRSFEKIKELSKYGEVTEVDIFGWDPANDWFALNFLKFFKKVNLYIFENSIPKDRIEKLKFSLLGMGIIFNTYDSKYFLVNNTFNNIDNRGY